MRLLLHLPILLALIGWALAETSGCIFGVADNYVIVSGPPYYHDEMIQQFGEMKCSSKCEKEGKCLFAYWAPQERRCKLYSGFSSGIINLKAPQGPNPKEAKYFLKTPNEFIYGRYMCSNPRPHYYNRQTVSIGSGGKYMVLAADKVSFQINPMN